ncbi:MAG: tetratricopeptide repeat protein [Proteobacteria bacterium]|nr:tetratricopeptide repeat protein [Pseudomonadota bacterium]
MILTVPRRRIVIALLALFIAAVSPAWSVFAFSSGSTGSSGGDPDLRKGDAAVIEKRFDDALASYQRVISKDPENADAWSQTGFSLRKLGRVEEALDAYQHALEIDPFHLGANEYLGELYLQTDQVEKAEEMAGILRRACPTGCEELTELTDAIDAYRKSGGSVKWNK